MQQKLLSRFLLLFLTFAPVSLLAQQPQVLDDEPEVFTPSKVRIAINKKYFEACEVELGPFPKEKINCADAVLIPTERTLANDKGVERIDQLPEGIPRFRNSERGQLKLNSDTHLFDGITPCDKPSGIFRDMRHAGCVPGNRIKHLVNQIKGGQTVDWVYICRKNTNFPNQGSGFNELGLIGYNRNTGKTCFFAGQPTEKIEVKGEWKIAVTEGGKEVEKTETKAEIRLIPGEDIPAPSFSTFNEKMVRHWSMPTGDGGCTRCHSNGPFIRYPFNEPVCLVSGTSENCINSFADVEACEQSRDKAYSRSERFKYQCRVLKPKRQPGMLYSVVSPFEPGELNKFLETLSATDNEDSYRKELRLGWHVPERLVSPEAKACMQCHAIGSGAYPTFVRSLFSVHSLKDKKFEPSDDNDWRVKLFLSNVSETQRSDSAHDKKIKTVGILPIRVGAKSIEEENESRRNLSLTHYQKALQKIIECAPRDTRAKLKADDNASKEVSNGQSNSGCQWDVHWTVERVRQEPLRYLQENCSYCHAPEMARPVLFTEADFKRPGLVNRIIGRMHEPTYPMPPSGQLPSSVLPILVDYLRK